MAPRRNSWTWPKALPRTPGGLSFDAGDLAEIRGDLRVVDPLLADWIRSRFPL